MGRKEETKEEKWYNDVMNERQDREKEGRGGGGGVSSGSGRGTTTGECEYFYDVI